MPKSACFTGHRPHKLGGYDPNSPLNQQVIGQLRQIIWTLIQHGYDRFVTGGALGVDQWAAAQVLQHKEQYPGIKLVIAIPFVGFSSQWPPQSQQHLAELWEMADETHIVCPSGYAAVKMQLRNQFLVTSSELVVAVWDGTAGGTGNCVQYAQSLGRAIVHYTPNTGRTTWPALT